MTLKSRARGPDADRVHDDLTGLAGPELLADHLTRAIARTGRGRTVALLVCDLDGFSVVNDLLGRAVGDAVLREAARRLTACCRAGDVVARTGDDQFALLLADLPMDPRASADVAHERTDVVREQLSRPYLEAEAVPVSASVGVALTPDPDTDAAALHAAARRTMRGAKDVRRMHVVRP